MTKLAITAYITALVTANLLVATYGPAIAAANAFVLIGLDLVLRDYLHDTWHTNRTRNMLALIASAAAISYTLNPATGRIAIASTVAITLAAAADWIVYASARRLPWLARSNASNAAASLVDSLTFPTIAFGSIMPAIIAAQIAAKIAGGIIWSAIIAGARHATTHHNRATLDA